MHKCLSLALCSAFFVLLFLCPSAQADGGERELRAGNLAGTLLPADKPDAPVVIIIPGSGPTDQDGNNPLIGKGMIYRQLAVALARQGVSSLRVDKRGMFGSAAEGVDPNAVTLADYAEDIQSWVNTLKSETGATRIWLAGHSEGGLVALTAAGQTENINGIILLATPGRPIGEILRAQLTANPANVLLLPAANAVITALEKGDSVDVATIPHPLRGLFHPGVQPFLIDLMRRDPTALMAEVGLPALIVQGGNDLQILPRDADLLHAANPQSALVVVDGMTHALRHAASSSRADNLATYADAAMPTSPEAVKAMADFIRENENVE